METNATVPWSLFNWAVCLAGCDQSRWLRKYTVHELGELLLRHQQHVVALHAVDGSPAGLAIGIPMDEGETIHIAFIVVLRPAIMAKFCELLRQMYPSATKISYIRRDKLAFTEIENLSRMLALTCNRIPTTNCLLTSN